MIERIATFQYCNTVNSFKFWISGARSIILLIFFFGCKCVLEYRARISVQNTLTFTRPLIQKYVMWTWPKVCTFFIINYHIALLSASELTHRPIPIIDRPAAQMLQPPATGTPTTPLLQTIMFSTVLWWAGHLLPMINTLMSDLVTVSPLSWMWWFIETTAHSFKLIWLHW